MTTLDRDQVEIDMIEMNGPDFEEVDNRLLSLQLVKNGMTDAVIFSPDGRNLAGVRRPVQEEHPRHQRILPSRDQGEHRHDCERLASSSNRNSKVEEEDIQVLFEITLNNLSAEGDIDEQDFLDRADILCSIGQTVLISNYQKYYKLIEFLLSAHQENAWASSWAPIHCHWSSMKSTTET